MVVRGRVCQPVHHPAVIDGSGPTRLDLVRFAGGRGRIGDVTRFYQLDEATERLVDVEPILERLRDQRSQLIDLRDEVDATDDAETIGALRLRMQGVIDQMQADVGRLDGWDISLRDIGSGLIDFPALAGGRQVWLCWRLGEHGIDWWHELEDGFGGRRPLLELT